MSEHGDLIRETRKSKRITQRGLAQAVGNTDSHIARIEGGYQRGSYLVLTKISRYLNLPVALILQQAGYEVDGIGNEKLEFDSETYRFATLSPEVKKALLELVPGVSKVVES